MVRLNYDNKVVDSTSTLQHAEELRDGLNGLAQAIKAEKADANKRIAEVGQENEVLRKELASTKTLKDKILADMDAFRKGLESQNTSLQSQGAEVAELRRACDVLRAELESAKSESKVREDESSRFAAAMHEKLSGIMEKYESVDFVTRNLQMKRGKDFSNDPVCL